jgi:hypothetical protein
MTSGENVQGGALVLDFPSDVLTLGVTCASSAGFLGVPSEGGAQRVAGARHLDERTSRNNNVDCTGNAGNHSTCERCHETCSHEAMFGCQISYLAFLMFYFAAFAVRASRIPFGSTRV